jgi:hypothetical protein
MPTWVSDMQRLAKQGDVYRLVAHTEEHGRIVVMCVRAGDEIGNETHSLRATQVSAADHPRDQSGR